MSESQAREMAPREGSLAWLEVRDDAIAWIAADRPEWRAGVGANPDRPLLSRMIAELGIPKNPLYRMRESQNSGMAAAMDSTSIACIVAAAAAERGVSDEVAFGRLFKVVRARDLVEAMA